MTPVLQNSLPYRPTGIYAHDGTLFIGVVVPGSYSTT